MVRLTDYVRKRGLNKGLEQKVKNYFEYIHKENIDECEKVIKNLKKPLILKIFNREKNYSIH